MVLLATDFARRHEPGCFEHRQVLHDAEARQRRDRAAERAERLPVLVEELVEQHAPAGIGERSKHVVHGAKIGD